MRLIQTFSKDKSHQIVRDHCHFTSKYRGAAHSVFNLRFNMPNKIPVVFHNGTNYNDHVIIREFKGKFEYLRENIEKYKTFSVPIEK